MLDPDLCQLKMLLVGRTGIGKTHFFRMTSCLLGGIVVQIIPLLVLSADQIAKMVNTINNTDGRFTISTMVVHLYFGLLEIRQSKDLIWEPLADDPSVHLNFWASDTSKRNSSAIAIDLLLSRDNSGLSLLLEREHFDSRGSRWVTCQTLGNCYREFTSIYKCQGGILCTKSFRLQQSTNQGRGCKEVIRREERSLRRRERRKFSTIESNAKWIHNCCRQLGEADSCCYLPRRNTSVTCYITALHQEEDMVIESVVDRGGSFGNSSKKSEGGLC